MDMNQATKADTLHVHDSSCSYLETIIRLRHHFRQPKLYVVPVSTNESDNLQFSLLNRKNKLEDIEIVDGKRSMKITVLLLNLYVVGFKTQAGTSWKFGDREFREIKADKRMKLNSDYSCLHKNGAAPVGLLPLHNAVDSLSRELRENANWEKEVARHLSTLIQMFSEAIRFNTVEDAIGKGWSRGVGVYLSSAERDLLNDWVTGTERAIIYGDRLVKYFGLKKKRGSSSPPTELDIIQAIREIQMLAKSHALMKQRGNN